MAGAAQAPDGRSGTRSLLRDYEIEFGAME
jgi:hypothetical protein